MERIIVNHLWRCPNGHIISEEVENCIRCEPKITSIRKKRKKLKKQSWKKRATVVLCFKCKKNEIVTCTGNRPRICFDCRKEQRRIRTKNYKKIMSRWNHLNQGFKKGHKRLNTGRTLFKNGGVPWNKGLSKIIDKRVLKYSETMKGLGFSDERREKIRKKRAEQKMVHVSSIEYSVRRLLDKVGIHYLTQYVILLSDKRNTFVDIYIPSWNLCIYCDGDYWHNREETKNRDSFVTRDLETKGYDVLRLWEHEIETSEDKCLEKILQYLK